MKKLFAVLLAVAMLLSLGVTAFAASIEVANHPDYVRYNAYKVFDAIQSAPNADGDVSIEYRLPYTSEFINVIANYNAAAAEETTSRITGLDLVYVDGANYFIVKKNVSFSAADFAETLRAAVAAAPNSFTGIPDNGVDNGTHLIPKDENITINIPDANPGYYLILSAAPATVADKTIPAKAFQYLTIQDTAALTTVLAGETVQIQNKNDMPLQKEVSGPTGEEDGDGVKLGDTLNYTITTKTPVLDDQTNAYIFRVTDTMSDGLTFQNELTITVGGHDFVITYTPKDTTDTAYPGKVYYPEIAVTIDSTPTTDYWTLVTDPDAELVGNQVRFGANGKTFELSMDVSSDRATSFRDEGAITIEYDAVVNENAVAEVLENRVVLAYGEDSDSLTLKDDSTKNYTSKILIDKFAEGNNTQKLAGAEFVLYRRNPTGAQDVYGNNTYDKEFYALTAAGLNDYGIAAGLTVGPVVITELKFDADGNVDLSDYTLYDADRHFCYNRLYVNWVSESDPHTKVVTDSNGFAQFGYLPDSVNNPDTDGKYYLLETKAPIDYTRLLNPIEIVVDGSASTEPSMNAEQQDMILTNIANVANTPGSTLPSTGGVGATLLTIGGVALILAAGAFLVLRRRKEQE